MRYYVLHMENKTKEALSSFISLLIILVIEVGVIMLCWNYVLHEVFNSNKCSVYQCIVFLLLARFVSFKKG